MFPVVFIMAIERMSLTGVFFCPLSVVLTVSSNEKRFFIWLRDIVLLEEYKPK